MRLRLIIPLLYAGLLPASVAGGNGSVPGITGETIAHTVAAGDTLTLIAARYGVYPSTIAAENQLEPRRALQAGRELRIDNRHIVPSGLRTGELVVNVPQRMVFYRDGERIFAFPIAVGRTTWRTPAGAFTVVRMEADPAWHVPDSIRAESARSGRLLPAVVPPGPRNPLGRYWIGLSLASIGIHGTPFPSSIYQTSTHGCLRLAADDIAALYARVHLGTRGEIIYEPVLMMNDGDDVFIEVHEDVYRRLPESGREQARELAARLGVSGRIDWTAADREIDRHAGVARNVRLKPDPTNSLKRDPTAS